MGPTNNRGSRAQQGAAPGASTRRGVPIWDASIRLVQWHSPRGLEINNARNSGVGDSPVWVKVPSGNLDKLTLLGTITPWSSGLRGWVRSPEVLTRPRSSAQGSQTFGFPPYAIVGRDDHFDWLSYKFAKASTHS